MEKFSRICSVRSRNNGTSNGAQFYGGVIIKSVEVNRILKDLENQKGGIQCLMYISKKKVAILSDFINDVNVPKGTISRALDMLYTWGLVYEKRLKHKNKRQISITEFGEKIAEVLFDINKIMNEEDKKRRGG